MIFIAILGIRIGPWPAGDPVADDPPDILLPVLPVLPLLPVRFRDPAAPEPIVPAPPHGGRIVHHHTSARHSPSQHPGHRGARTGHS